MLEAVVPGGTEAAVAASGVEWPLQPVHRSEDAGEIFAVLVGGFLVGLFLMYSGYDTWKLKRRIQDTPTSTVRSMPVGRVELEGEVREHERTVDPPYHDEPAVYVDWEAERREKHRDDDGDTYYTWETVASGTDALPFELADDTGSVVVRADIDAADFDVDDDENSYRVTFGRGEAPDPVVTEYIARARRREDRAERAEEKEKAEDGGVVDAVTDTVSDTVEAVTEESSPLTATHRRRRYTQDVLPVGNETYVLGGAEPREDASMDAGQQDLLEVTEDGTSEELFVADDTEKELTEEYSKKAPALALGGLVLSALTLFLLLDWYAVPLT